MNITTYKSSDMRRALCMGGLLAILCVMPLCATPDIANTATASCDDSVLQSDTGPVNIEIDWAPNHITLNWYEDSSATTPMTVGASSRSCDYNETNGTLVVPSAPAARTGYTFKGWRVRQDPTACFIYQCGLSSSVISGEAQSYGFENASSGYNANTYGLTSHTWAIQFSQGVIKGEASCNNTVPTELTSLMTDMQNGTITTEQAFAALYGNCTSSALRPGSTFFSGGSGQNCWCKMTSYTPTGGSLCSTASSVWVYLPAAEQGSECTDYCASMCSLMMLDTTSIPGFATAVLSGTH